MIRLAEPIDLMHVAIMMRDMYIELFGDKASININDYLKEVFKSYINPKHYIYVSDNMDGFFMVVDETSILAPAVKRINGTRVYIVPEARNKGLLHKLYKKLFEDFPDGDILGYTEINSKHIKVLEKRHEHIMNVYKLNRSL
ncbi:MAG: hypothetical protein JHC33_09090 [Ignisphaera sp.]|nr:hypothetical protein [Ignisphaera sp.]